MKNLIFAFVITATVTNSCVAQFNFNKAFKSVGSQVQRQVQQHVQREVQRHAPRVVRQVVDRTHHQKPCPKPTPRPKPAPKPCPIVRPLPHPTPRPFPQPAPQPHPCPTPEPPVCRIKPCPVQPVPQPQPYPQPAPEPVIELPQVEAGQQVTIDGRLFGSNTGSVIVRIGELQLEAQVTAWSGTQATVVLPQLPMAGSVKATVVVVTAFGNVADTLDVEIIPGSNRGGDHSGPGPVATAEKPVVSPGQQVTLEGRDMGSQPGRVQLQVGGLTLNATVSRWSATEAVAVLPTLNFANPVDATIQIVRADGRTVDQVDVVFAPEAEVAAR